MCDLLRKSSIEKIKGYKIVARKLKGKRYFSISMGFKYPLDGHIPIARKQRKICTDFSNQILSKGSSSYRKNMIGRTSAFLNLYDLSKSNHIKRWRKDFKNEYILVIVQVEISGDIMEGYYGSCKAVGGRHIRFIEEIQLG